MTAGSCRSCKFWKEGESQSRVRGKVIKMRAPRGLGLCNGPPKRPPMYAEFFSWPVTRECDWCAAWQKQDKKEMVDA